MLYFRRLQERHTLLVGSIFLEWIKRSNHQTRIDLSNPFLSLFNRNCIIIRYFVLCTLWWDLIIGHEWQRKHQQHRRQSHRWPQSHHQSQSQNPGCQNQNSSISQWSSYQNGPSSQRLSQSQLLRISFHLRKMWGSSTWSWMEVRWAKQSRCLQCHPSSALNPARLHLYIWSRTHSSQLPQTWPMLRSTPPTHPCRRRAHRGRGRPT